MRFTTFAAVSGLLLSVPATAADYAFTGHLTEDNTVQIFTVILDNAAAVSFRTWSYGGGTNAAGDEIASGGFDPYLSLFDAGGILVVETDDSLGANPDPMTGVAYDARYTTFLAAGTYYLALSQYSNFPVGPHFGAGFEFDDQPGALGGFCPAAYACGDPTDLTTIRTSAWALDVIGVSSASAEGTPPVPEPETYLLLGVGLTLLAAAVRRRR